ncbi:hypothetical protein [Porphyromonas sp.]
MNDQMNVLLELLEEIKQQNREIKASLTSQAQPMQGEGSSTNKEELNAIAQVLDAILQGNNGFKEELIGALSKLGQRIREMKEGVGELREAQDEALARLVEQIQTAQATQASVEVKLSKYYLFDAKRWAEWIVWGVLVATLTAVIGWAVYLYGANRSLESNALRYRALRMELGYNAPSVTRLDSLFSAEGEGATDSLRTLRQRVASYERAIQRQAELQLQQQRLTEEQAALFPHLHP